MNIFDECSPNELRILEFFAKSIEENPQKLKESLNSVSITERARILSFIKVRVPKLYEKINKQLEEQC